MTDYKCKKCGAFTTDKGRKGSNLTLTTVTSYFKKEKYLKCKCGHIEKLED